MENDLEEGEVLDSGSEDEDKSKVSWTGFDCSLITLWIFLSVLNICWCFGRVIKAVGCSLAHPDISLIGSLN